VSDPEVVLSPSADELAQAAAARTIETLDAAIGARGEAHLAITGGSILEQVLGALAGLPLKWPLVHVWWGDERYVASDSDERNEIPVHRLLLDNVDVDPAKVHALPASDAGSPSVEAAAER
jgi:6-phosphogluconolactonase